MDLAPHDTVGRLPLDELVSQPAHVVGRRHEVTRTLARDDEARLVGERTARRNGEAGALGELARGAGRDRRLEVQVQLGLRQGAQLVGRHTSCPT
ncbi:hypothetical protein GCM10028802_05210 [Terrabacter terrigena]